MLKPSVAIVFGGKSPEHEISKLSAESILREINREQYDVSAVYIDIEGTWLLKGEKDIHITLTQQAGQTNAIDSNGQIVSSFDVIFPVLHGVYGEDGTIQGLFRMLDVAFVGCDVLASALCMDKDMTKRLLRDANISIAPYMVASTLNRPSYQQAIKALGTPLFLKPANLGSSVGVYKVDNEAEYEKRLTEGLTLDNKVLIEQTISGREIEVAVMGNEQPRASYPGEIIIASEFYDFESKYAGDSTSTTACPADLTEAQTKEIRETAALAYSTLGCEGLARVDFFLANNGDIMINEVNTMPGFTSISMYPKMWEATGISYSELINMLIEFGIERYNRNKSLKIFAKEVR